MIDDDEPTNFLSNLLIDEMKYCNHLQVTDTAQKALAYLQNALNPLKKENEFPLPNLILLDINMPCMNGWEFLEEYKKIADSKLANVIIIMLTTSQHPDDKLKAEAIAEVSGFENKPLTTEMMERVLNNYAKKQERYSIY